MIRLILADDHIILRDELRVLLAQEPDLEVVEQASNGLVLLELLAQTAVDVVVLDVNMPVMDGLATTKAIRERFPTVRVLVLSMLDHEQYIQRMLKAGALGYLLKSSDIQEITYAIRTVARNRPYLCTDVGLSLLQKLTPPEATTADKSVAQVAGGLSAREQQVLPLLAAGLTNAEIADQLFTSKHTIEVHRQNIIQKTQASSISVPHADGRASLEV
ncbi:response regulator transcription factor [Hymenobacter cavernae]|uniref:DNA-binding response regulator n=1 Tax=Hymenobacter cavernae TaxID=2044852 RepID=A0ABQ1TQ02_9BACT|nr:response regulator transcription factor [Hymenobacter cavernae]GGE99639.1 DNA-binding response regulator [Hymenobacter cavernae]